MPSSDKPRALHQLVARTIREEIAQGLPPIGALLPGEHHLCTRFASSRHTVRDALRTLAEQGLIERRQGAGTRVIADRPRGPYQPAMHSIDDLRQYAAETVLRLSAVQMRIPDEHESALLGSPAADVNAQAWLQVDGVRWAGTERLCSNRVFIHQRFADLLLDLHPGATLTTSINELVSARSSSEVSSVEQDIAARPMPAEVARSLGVPSGTTALLFIRRYRDASGQIMVWSLNWHPADRFTYRMRLQQRGE